MDFLLSGIMAITWQQCVMYVVGGVLIYLAIQKGFENLKDGTEYDNLRQHCLIPSESAKTYDSPAVKSIFVTFAESNKGNSKPYQNNPCVPLTRRGKRTTSTTCPTCYVWYAWHVVR